MLRSTPGFAADSVNQAHPRGEHSATALNINGFYLPGALQGRAGQVIIPEIVQTLDILTGAYAPEYGGETAAILNLSLRAGPITPIRRFFLEGGQYSIVDGAITAGGQAGSAFGPPDEQGRRAEGDDVLGSGEEGRREAGRAADHPGRALRRLRFEAIEPDLLLRSGQVRLRLLR